MVTSHVNNSSSPLTVIKKFNNKLNKPIKNGKAFAQFFPST